MDKELLENLCVSSVQKLSSKTHTRLINTRERTSLLKRLFSSHEPITLRISGIEVNHLSDPGLASDLTSSYFIINCKRYLL